MSDTDLKYTTLSFFISLGLDLAIFTGVLVGFTILRVARKDSDRLSNIILFNYLEQTLNTMDN